MLFLILADSIAVDARFATKDPVFLRSEIHSCSYCMDCDPDLGDGQSPPEDKSSYKCAIIKRSHIVLGVA